MALPLTTEVVVYNIDSALAARQGGADRIELCDNPGGGGTTPSDGTIRVVRDLLDIPLFVMIRPREGDFCYSSHEFEAMKHDIARCRDLGADGVVFGLLTPDGRIDRERSRILIERAGPLGATCHRAFDMTRDAQEALEDCVDAGFDRILTSGQQASAAEGLPLIAELHRRAGTRISVMPGCGVTEETVEAVLRAAPVKEIHISAEEQRASPMEFRNTNITGMGSLKGGEYTRQGVSADRVRAIRRKALQVLHKEQ